MTRVRRGRRIACSTAACALALILFVGFPLLRREISSAWLCSRLARAPEAEKVEILGRLGELGSARAAMTIAGEIGLGTDRRRTCLAALKALQALGPAARDAVPRLLGAARSRLDVSSLHHGFEVVQESIAALAAAAPQHLPWLIEDLARAPGPFDPEFDLPRRLDAAIRALKSEGIPSILRIMTSMDATGRGALASGTALVGTSTVAGLEDALGSPERAIRDASVTILAEMARLKFARGHEPGEAVAMLLLEPAPPDAMLSGSVEAVGRALDLDPEKLLRLPSAIDEEVLAGLRSACIESHFSMQHPDRRMEVLVSCLVRDVRLAHSAQEALVGMGVKAAPVLLDLLGHEAADVRARAESALWELAANDEQAADHLRAARDSAAGPMRDSLARILELAGK